MLLLWGLIGLTGFVASRTVLHDDTFQPDHVLVATLQPLGINCHTRNSVVINGTSPGPTLHLKEAQTTWIRVYNEIDNLNFTIHWHGLSQRAAPFSDGTPLVSQWPIPPRQYFDYEIRPVVGDAGSYFYHSHVGFQQVTAHGALLVHEARTKPYQYDGDIPLLLGDYYPANDTTIEQGLLANPFKWSGEPEAVTVNGQSGNSSSSNATDSSCLPHVINVSAGKTYRLRFIGSTAISFTKFVIEEHPDLDVIEADGEYTVLAHTSYVQVAPGQRFSYLLHTKTEAELRQCGKSDFWIRYETRDRPTVVTGYALLRYDSLPNASKPIVLPDKSPVEMPNNTLDYLENILVSKSRKLQRSFPTLSEVTRTVTIQMNQVLISGNSVNGSLNGSVRWAQNGYYWQESQQAATQRTPYLVQVYNTGMTPNYTLALENYGHDPETNTWPAEVGEVIDIVWQNNNGPTGGWDFHPMHVHGEHVYDLGGGNGTYDAEENEKKFGSYTPARRDTTVLYRYATKGAGPNETAGWRAWRIRVTEGNVGAWLMHCHVAQHSVMGMNTVWVFGDTEAIVSKFPVAPYISGYLDYGGSAYGAESSPPLVNHHFDREM